MKLSTTISFNGDPKKLAQRARDLEAAGIDMVHVPFAGLGPATNALIAGTVDVGLVTPPQAKPHAASGSIRVLAVTGNKRYAAMPDVPTLKEAGLNVSTIVGYGLSAPAGTPEPVLTKLKQGISNMMKDKALIARLSELGYETDAIGGLGWVLVLKLRHH